MPNIFQPVLASQYGPTAQDFANELAQLQKTAPGQIRTGGALASNLLADALLQYGERQAKQAEANQPASGTNDPSQYGPGSAQAGAPGQQSTVSQILTHDFQPSQLPQLQIPTVTQEAGQMPLNLGQNPYGS